MGLLEQEIKELRIMNKQVMQGKMTPEQVNSRIAIYSQTGKRAKMILQAMTLGAKHGKKIMAGLESSNLLGNHACIDLCADPEMDTVQCPDLDKTITRHTCLDYSGEEAHNESCSSCEQFDITRSMLLPKII